MSPLNHLLIATALQFALGGTLLLLFQRNPLWRHHRVVRLVALSTIFMALTLHIAVSISFGHALGAVFFSVVITLLAHLPIAAHLVTHESALAAQSSELSHTDESLSWVWSLRRRLLIGGESRRRRLWEKKRNKLPNQAVDPILRLELLELSVGLGKYGEALYHAYALDELLPKGNTHAEVIYRRAQILAELQQRLAAAQPTLHRLIRLYPQSSNRQEAERLIRLYEEAL